MKRLIALTVGLALAGLASLSFATPQDQAFQKVAVNVTPHIRVLAGAAPAIPKIQAGEFSIPVAFRIDANTESVKLWALVSVLYKGDVVSATPDVAPIPLGHGCDIAVAGANPINGGGILATFDPALPNEIVAGYPTTSTTAIQYESAQNNRFSNDVLLSCFWNQDDNEKPQGQYSGVVKLVGAVAFIDP